MTKTNLLDVQTPNVEQELILRMIHGQKQKLELTNADLENLSVDIIETLENKGYTVVLGESSYIETDYNEASVDFDRLKLNTEKLACNNIPAAGRVRSYITSKQAERLVIVLLAVEDQLERNEDVNLLKSAVPNDVILHAALKELNLEIAKDHEYHYQIRSIKA